VSAVQGRAAPWDKRAGKRCFLAVGVRKEMRELLLRVSCNPCLSYSVQIVSSLPLIFIV
jgi:hypothetical protein